MDRRQSGVWVVVVFLVLGGVQGAGAQVPDEGPSSIGVSNPDSTRPVRAYRLPTWHWSTWTLRANGRAFRSSGHWERAPGPGGSSGQDADRFDVGLELNPAYRSFWESEKRRAVLRLSPVLGLSRNGRTTSGEEEARSLDRSEVRSGLRLDGTLREYVGRRTFLLASSVGHLSYQRQWTEDEEGRATFTDFDVRMDVRFGLGVGRVRIVTPVIRALRVRERLRTLSPDLSISDDQVQRAARQLARRPGYQAVYDRPDKYFWRDFFDRVGLSGRAPFEVFYVADVLREPVGIRREGAEFIVGPIGTYDRFLQRQERSDQLVDRRCSEAGTLGGFARGRWYRNVTLRHQLGLDAGATYRRFVNSRGTVDHEVALDAEAQWLWMLADRLRLDTRLRTHLLYLNDPRGGETFRPRHRYVLSSDLLIFVENSLSLRAGANVRYRYDATEAARGHQSEFSMGLQFRINYVLSRALR